MKPIVLPLMLLLAAISVTACSDSPTTNNGGSRDCGTYEGFQLYKDAAG